MKELIELLTVAIPLLIFYLKFYFDNKKTAKENKVAIKKITEDISEIKTDLKLHIGQEEANNKIKYAILDKGIDIISMNTDLSQRIKYLLVSGQRLLIDFAVEFYHSNYRNNEQEKIEYLKIITDSINDKLRNIALIQFTHIKIVQNEDTDFVDFIKKYTSIYILIKIYVQTLVKNGLNMEEYIIVCEDFTRNIFLECIKGWRRWNDLKIIIK